MVVWCFFSSSGWQWGCKIWVDSRLVGFWSSARSLLPRQSIARGDIRHHDFGLIQKLWEQDGWMDGWKSHLVPSFQRPLPPLEEISLTDTRCGQVSRTVTSRVTLYLQVLDNLPVFDHLYAAHHYTQFNDTSSDTLFKDARMSFSVFHVATYFVDSMNYYDYLSMNVVAEQIWLFHHLVVLHCLHKFYFHTHNTQDEKKKNKIILNK